MAGTLPNTEQTTTMQMHENGEKFECECGLFEYMGMTCCHMLKVMDVLGYTEIPAVLILKRWTRDARDVLPSHMQVYQRDHAGSRTMTHRHTTLYVHAMELVRLGDASAEAYEKGMKVIRDGIAALAEYEDHRDGLGLEDRPEEPQNAVEKTTVVIPDEDHAAGEMRLDTLVGSGAPEKKRKQGQPT